LFGVLDAALLGNGVGCVASRGYVPLAGCVRYAQVVRLRRVYGVWCRVCRLRRSYRGKAAITAP
jgi:hypothetical protein